MREITLDQSLRHLADSQKDAFTIIQEASDELVETMAFCYDDLNQRVISLCLYKTNGHLDCDATQDDIDSIAAKVGEGWEWWCKPYIHTVGLKVEGIITRDRWNWAMFINPINSTDEPPYHSHFAVGTKRDAAIAALIAIISAEHGEPT